MAERLTPYLLRRALQLPLQDKTMLMGHLRASLNAPSSPVHRLQYLRERMQLVAGFDVTVNDRRRESVTARYIFVFVARQEGFSQAFIGSFIGRDHSTVSFAEKRMQDVFTYPNAYKEEINLYNKFVESL